MTFADGTAGSASPTGTERAVLGPGSVVELRSFLNAYAIDRLGSPIADVRFRAGRPPVEASEPGQRRTR